mmetsp:Transcript_17985/g.50129  ORF Transcript_17985/g.50129 Transcript_17985/m.50129 type:complete len:409 (-) Transcript_17985:534-1760(-)
MAKRSPNKAAVARWRSRSTTASRNHVRRDEPFDLFVAAHPLGPSSRQASLRNERASLTRVDERGEVASRACPEQAKAMLKRAASGVDAADAEALSLHDWSRRCTSDDRPPTAMFARVPVRMPLAVLDVVHVLAAWQLPAWPPLFARPRPWLTPCCASPTPDALRRPTGAARCRGSHPLGITKRRSCSTHTRSSSTTLAASGRDTPTQRCMSIWLLGSSAIKSTGCSRRVWANSELRCSASASMSCAGLSSRHAGTPKAGMPSMTGWPPTSLPALGSSNLASVVGIASRPKSALFAMLVTGSGDTSDKEVCATAGPSQCNFVPQPGVKFKSGAAHMECGKAASAACTSRVHQPRGWRGLSQGHTGAGELAGGNLVPPVSDEGDDTNTTRGQFDRVRTSGGAAVSAGERG